MRVAMIILEYHPIVGGAQRQLAGVAPLLLRRGVEIDVITRAVPGLPAFETIDGVRVHRLAAPGPKAVASLCFTAEAFRLLRELAPDLIHAYSLFSPATIALISRSAAHIPAVLKILRGGSAGDVQRLHRKTLGRLRARTLTRRIDRFLTLSDEIDHELEVMGVPSSKRIAIPNGVDVNRFRRVCTDARRAARLQLGLDTDARIVIYCGRLVAEKRVDLLIEAWRSVGVADENLQLHVVGDGPERKRLELAAGSGVHFDGSQDDVVAWLQSADLFVLPSEAEGMSNSLLEAAAVGLPIVATRVGGASDIIRDRESGRLVASQDAEALSRVIRELLDDPRAAEMGQKASEIIQEGYSLDSVAEKLDTLYRELTEQHAPQTDAAVGKSSTAVFGASEPVRSGSIENENCASQHLEEGSQS